MYLPTDDVLSTALLRVERDQITVREAVRLVCGPGLMGSVMRDNTARAMRAVTPDADWTVDQLREAVAAQRV